MNIDEPGPKPRLAVIGGTAPVPPSWFAPHTEDTIRKEKAAAQERVKRALETIRPSLRILLEEDPAVDPTRYAAACKAAWLPISILEHDVLKAAYGEDQARYVEELERGEFDLSSVPRDCHAVFESLRAEAERRRATLPHGWTPTNEEERAAALVNSVEGSECAQAAKIPLGSKWRPRNAPLGYVGIVIGYTTTDGAYVQMRFGSKGQTWDQGNGMVRKYSLTSFSNGELTRADLTEEQKRMVPVGSLWRRGSHTYRVVAHEDARVLYRNVKGKRTEDWEPFKAFVGPNAIFRRATSGKLIPLPAPSV